MTNDTTIPRGRPHGTGHVVYRCHICQQELPQSDAVLIHIDGKLVAMHGRHQQEGLTHGR